MNKKGAKVIISLIGVAGFILYGYLLFMSDISVDYQKYIVFAASLGVLFPLGALSDNEYLSGNGYKAFGVGFLGACVILFAGYASKIDTEDGIIWDFFKAITTEGYRHFYFFLLLVANIFPLVSRKYSIWFSAFTIGIMTPVLIVSLLALAIIIGILSEIGASGKSNGSSNSSSSIYSNTSGTNNNTDKEGGCAPYFKPDDSPPYIPRANFLVEWKHTGHPLTYKSYFYLPVDVTVCDFIRELQKLCVGDYTIVSYRRGNDTPVYLEGDSTYHL